MFRGSQSLDFVTPKSVAVHLGKALHRPKSEWEGFVGVTFHSGEYQRALTVSNQGLLLQVAMCLLRGGVRGERKAVA